MKRPIAGDCADYFLGYSNKVPDGDVLGTLERELEVTSHMLAGIDEERAGFRYAPEKWSVREVVGHLVDTERVFAFRALWFARADAQALPGFEEDDFNAAASFDQRTLDDIASELRTVRAATLSLFRGMSTEELERVGTANDSTFVTRSVPWILAGHELHHRAVLRDRYGL